MFRINSTTKQFQFERKYLFFFALGNVIKLFCNGNQKVMYGTKDQTLFFNENQNDYMSFKQVDKKNSGWILKPLGDYLTLCVGFY